MAPVHRLLVRSSDVTLSGTTVDLLIVLLALLLTSLVAVAALILLRRYRKARLQAGDLQSSKPSKHRRRNSQSYNFVQNEKQQLLASASGPPTGPLPEIHITFAEEVDESGKRQSGRVVVVHLGEKGDIGLEPFAETLPPYQQSASDRFHSLDLERLGGLKEKLRD